MDPTPTRTYCIFRTSTVWRMASGPSMQGLWQHGNYRRACRPEGRTTIVHAKKAKVMLLARHMPGTRGFWLSSWQSIQGLSLPQPHTQQHAPQPTKDMLLAFC